LSILTLTSIVDLAANESRDLSETVVLNFAQTLNYLAKTIFKQLISDKSEEMTKSFIKNKKNENKIIFKDPKSVKKLIFKDINEEKRKLKAKNEDLLSLAGFLIQALVESLKCKVKEKEPQLIEHNLKWNPLTQRSEGQLIISHKFLKIITGNKGTRPRSINYLYLERTLPMICPPVKWIDHETGGYLHKGFSIMRTQGSKLQKLSLERADLSKICEVLNFMGDTPWRINCKILAVTESLYNLGGGVGEIPIVDRGDKFVPKEGCSFMEKQKILQEKRDNWSLLSDFELKLGIARKFKEIERFYLPLNLDFRGRIYPISPHLNQIGNDLARGLIEFADGKPLGETGFRWLKIHLANKMGFDKLPINERIEIVENMMPEIWDMANNPLANRKWLSYEDQWQSLATIFELTAAIQSGDPTNYVSHLHIHQDGSCNGLQHYAALGRDIEGAEQVNLIERDRPGDLYSAVAVKVQEQIDEDALSGNELALKLQGKIKRKIVKQTVMTSVYGVTFIGARDQIFRQLKDRAELNEEDLKPASIYITKITMAALEGFFQGAQRIKLWLIDCAGRIAKSGHPVSWITPLGLPVVQPYRKGTNSLFIDTFFQRVTFEGNKDGLPISVPKQKSAFPPNFVHSLDSTHLMMTALACKYHGIEFAAVHDSFWTHACNIEKMNNLLREEFVNLHSQPLLDVLLKNFREMYPSIQFHEVPKRGDFELSRVLNSTYFFA
jgi:DNA-directed RNA polymerase